MSRRVGAGDNGHAPASHAQGAEEGMDEDRNERTVTVHASGADSVPSQQQQRRRRRGQGQGQQASSEETKTGYSSSSSLLHGRGENGKKKKQQQQHRLDDDDDDDDVPKTTATTAMPALRSTPHPAWIVFALCSGAFAAFNGVFAKLTTTPTLTASLSRALSGPLSLPPAVLSPVLRALFFALNLASNAVMWVLFTRALLAHPSSTKVSVVNTGANFALTAALGWLVFGESVGGWRGGAGLAMLALGCVVLGRGRDGAEAESGGEGEGERERLLLVAGMGVEREAEMAEVGGGGRKIGAL